jgi:hypothetical protein
MFEEFGDGFKVTIFRKVSNAAEQASDFGQQHGQKDHVKILKKPIKADKKPIKVAKNRRRSTTPSSNICCLDRYVVCVGAEFG